MLMLQSCDSAMPPLTQWNRSQPPIAFQTSLLDQLNDAILTVDSDFRITYWNAGAERLFGWAADEAIGQKYKAIAGTAVTESERETIHTDILSRGSWNGEIICTKRDGTQFLVHVSWSVLRDDEGRPATVVGIHRDLTAPKHMEQALRASQDRLKLAESALSLGSWEVDLASETVRCSAQLLRMYGLPESRKTLTAAEWHSLVHRDDRYPRFAGARSLFQGGDSFDRQFRVVWPDGSIHWLHSKARVIGGEDRVIGVDFEITQIKQLQSQLAQAQKLESVGHLAAGIAHEINTPIQYIGDNGKFLEDAFRDLIQFAEARAGKETAGAAPPLSQTAVEEGVLEYLREEVPKAITQLLEGVEQVARIVRAMKEFSHPGPVEKAAADINRAIENTILVSKNEWKYVADLTVDLDPNLPPIPCVVGEFHQVVLNLIVNAAHAIGCVVNDSGLKGKIHISTRQIDSAVEVRISDTGGGIPEAIQSKVFDPFFTTKPVGKGTGQGLAIAYSVVVQKHKGVLTFETEAGLGTTFIIQLPLVREVEVETAVN
jgi:PAS domain S-box-containing protein